MMLVRCRTGPSAIDGLGVFALEPVAAGQPVWRLQSDFDRLLAPDIVASLPAAQQEFLARHAYFDALHPARSGIFCHGDEVLSGGDLASLSNLPALVFFNACEAGRIRSRPARGKEPRDIRQRIERNVSFAEAFLRGGVANFIGTWWPVSDEAASTFAAALYKDLAKGESIGEALRAARSAVRGLPSADWANYLHYGSYDFTLKAPKG